jgi:cell fate regulator YaaT (PSP1 superfamily)
MLRVNDLVLVDSERGTDAGFVSMTGSLVHAKRKAKKLSSEPIAVLTRKATVADAERYNRNRSSELEAMRVCRARIESFALPMKLVDAEWQFDHHRITFFFTADGRVDFRELVRDLASIFRTRIELRQIAVRDEAKRIGGMGVCGRELCCTTHLGRYEHITLDHAKTQALQLNPTKLSGQCGRLKCCLLYELDAYVDGLKRFPPIESTVRTTKGDGKVAKIDIFRDILYLHHDATGEWETITLDELKKLATERKKEGKG